ncbi:MAG: phosphoribosyltransferase [Thiobacillaceae bacterium]|jgi:putative phosphoribosyl transferase
MFHNRLDAAERLAQALSQYQGKNPLVLGIPRGAVPMARHIATTLGGEVDVVLVRKLTSPYNPEFALGAVDESGWMFVGDHAAHYGGTPEYLEEEKARQLETMRQRRGQYTPIRPPFDPAGRIVIVVDDGLATGSTMIAALHALRAKKPARVICAVPVAPPDTVEKVANYCDEMVCLETPWAFQAVGQFYQEFPQVSDEEVVAALAN